MTDVTVSGAQPSMKESLIRALIIVEGVITVGMTALFLPVGLVGVLVNAVLAVASRGVNRKLFAGFAIAGAIAALAIGFGLMAVSGSGVTQSTLLN